MRCPYTPGDPTVWGCRIRVRADQCSILDSHTTTLAAELWGLEIRGMDVLRLRAKVRRAAGKQA